MMADSIESRLAAEDWVGARRLIRAALRRTPDSHWLHARLGLTYYEEWRYRLALRWSQKALALAPRCPLVLWEYAGDLQAIGRHREAVHIYERLLRRGVEGIAHGECGEGRRWARGLLADVLYRLGLSCLELRRPRRAQTVWMRHLAMRGRGTPSIYPARTVREALERLGVTARRARAA
jgi:tetratricopeptide (TPR) repeat protein